MSGRDGGNPPAINLPPATGALIGIILAAQLALSFFGDDLRDLILRDYSFNPARLSAEPGAFGALFTLISHQALHLSWFHCGINALVLAAFGSGVERMSGARLALLIGLGAGVAGALAEWAAAPTLAAHLVGASGATSGLLAAALFGMHRSGVIGNAFWFLVLGWIAFAVFTGADGAPGSEHPVSWIAHVAGFMFGLLVAILLFGGGGGKQSRP